jgi:hypothetical protein
MGRMQPEDYLTILDDVEVAVGVVVFTRSDDSVCGTIVVLLITMLILDVLQMKFPASTRWRY